MSRIVPDRVGLRAIALGLVVGMGLLFSSGAHPCARVAGSEVGAGGSCHHTGDSDRAPVGPAQEGCDGSTCQGFCHAVAVAAAAAPQVAAVVPIGTVEEVASAPVGTSAPGVDHVPLV